MVEANKAKMAANAAAPTQTPSTRLTSTNYTGSLLDYFGPSKDNAPSTPPSLDDVQIQEEQQPIDLPSRQGKFEWVQLGEEYLPCILRSNDEQFCSVRMVESYFIGKYIRYLSSDIYACTCVRSYFITEVEAKLLSEISIKHCEGKFGREPFTKSDLVVKFADAREFHNYLVLCYNRLVNPLCKEASRCGFIRINSESVVPYTTMNDKQYVPLFYFEGETDNLKSKSASLEMWDLAYLKFCCKVQGIRSELFECESCSVISLDDIKAYFPTGTVFEEYWPPKVVDSQLLLQDDKDTTPYRPGAVSWVKVPPGMASPPAPPISQPPVTAIPLSKGASMVGNQGAVVTNGWPPVPNTQAQQAQAQGVLPRYSPMPQQGRQHNMPPQVPVSLHNGYSALSAQHQANSIQRNYMPRGQNSLLSNVPSYYPNMHPSAGHPSMSMSNAVSRLMSQVQTQQSGQNMQRMSPANHMGNPSQYSAPNSHSAPVLSHSNSMPLMNSSHLSMPHIQYSPHNSASSNNSNSNNGASSQAKFPPALIPVNGSNPSYYRRPPSSSAPPYDLIDLSSPPQSPQRSLLQNGKQHQMQQAQQRSSSNKSAMDSQAWKRGLIPVPEIPLRQQGSAPPFTLQRALVNNKMVPCINMKPYVNADLMMTINDLLENFFPQVPVGKCREVLQNVLKVNLYLGNLQQMTVLKENKKCQSLNEFAPLIQVKDVINYMPQMKYILERLVQQTEGSASKRQRVS